jgi:ATP phosphoribosyltransferase
LVLAVPGGSGIESVGQLSPRARVATSFPRLAGRFFEAHALRPRLVPISGAAEIAPHLGVADAIVDLASSGSTLKVNGLREIATLLRSSARLFCAGGDSAEPAAAELKVALEGVVQARPRRYLMANVPRERLDEVRAVVPGVNGPTVSDVLDGGRHVAVHAVVEVAAIRQTLSRLKAIGCEGILVTRIERFLP